MSISGLGAGFSNPIAALSPTVELPGFKTGPTSAADEAAAKVAASRAKQEATLNEIREKGIYAWAQEQKLKKLEEKARQQVLQDRGVSEADLAKMPQSERTLAETSIQEAVAQLIKEALEKNLANTSAADADGQKAAGPMIIDISV